MIIKLITSDQVGDIHIVFTYDSMLANMNKHNKNLNSRETDIFLFLII